MSLKAWQPDMVKCVLRYLHDCLPQGLAAGSQHCSRRSDYKRGSSGPIVQLFQSSGISKVKKMWPDPKQAYIANTEPVFLCSASVQSQLGSVLCVSIQKTLWTQFKSILVCLVCCESWKVLCFCFVFFPGWLHWIATEVVVSQLERTCTIRSKVESSPTQSIFRWKREKVFAFYFNVFFSCAYKSNCFVSWWLLVHISIWKMAKLLTIHH